MNERLISYKSYLIGIHRSDNYFCKMRVLFSYLEKNNIQFVELTKEQLAEFFTQGNYKSKSINCFLDAGRDYCRFIQLEKSPFFEIKMLKVEQKLKNYITLDEINKAIKYIATEKSYEYSTKIQAILYFMIYTAIRKSALLLLKRSAFDLENNLVRVYEPKTKEEKIIPFPDNVKKKLINYFATEKEDINAFNIDEGTLNYLFKGILSKYIGRKVYPHLTRSGGITLMFEKGLPPNIIMQIAGHKDLKTTMIYARPTQKDIERIYRERIK